MSIACTPFTRRVAQSVRTVLIALPLVVACSSGSASDDPTPTPIVDGSVPTTSMSEPTPTVEVTTEPTRSAAFEALLAPGPTLAAPGGIFFEADDEIWYLPEAETARRVVEDQEIGPWAPTIDGTRIAFVRYREEAGADVEEIVLAGNNGDLSDPVYGPAPTTGPSIHALDWSWDSQLLAVVLSDGTVATMRFANDPFATKPPLEPVATPDGEASPEELAWAPSGAGVAYTIGGNGGDALYVSPLDGEPHLVVAPGSSPSRAVQTFRWLPGRGRLAFVEAAGNPTTRLPGSLFTIAPDGTLLELLVSAGRFAPAATIAAISAAPDGRELAFTVHVPDDQGKPVFQSLWLLSIDSGELQQVPVETGYRVADLAWSAAGLIWRGIDLNTRVPGDGAAYSGDEPFILGRFDAVGGTSAIVFQSALAE